MPINNRIPVCVDPFVCVLCICSSLYVFLYLCAYLSTICLSMFGSSYLTALLCEFVSLYNEYMFVCLRVCMCASVCMCLSVPI